MRTAMVKFVRSLLTSAGLTLTPRRFDAVDRALSSRKIHKGAIPPLGGIAIVCRLLRPLIALPYVESGVGWVFLSNQRCFLGGALIAALGVYDDLRGARREDVVRGPVRGVEQGRFSSRSVGVSSQSAILAERALA